MSIILFFDSHSSIIFFEKYVLERIKKCFIFNKNSQENNIEDNEKVFSSKVSKLKKIKAHLGELVLFNPIFCQFKNQINILEYEIFFHDICCLESSIIFFPYFLSKIHSPSKLNSCF